jgi:hypothetical protein
MAGDAATPPLPGYATWLRWVMVLCVAVAIDRLTGSAALGTVLPCVHAAWKSIGCAFWLKRVDPAAARRRACFWFYLATACWKTAAWATFTILIFAGIEEFTGRPPTEDEIAVTLITLFSGVVLCTAVGMIAIAGAIRGKVRVWVHPNVREMCGGDFNRLGYCDPHRRRFNYAIFVTGTSLATLPAATGMVILGLCNPAIVPAAIGLFLVAAAPYGMIVVYALLSSRIIAQSPAECWPPSVAAG